MGRAEGRARREGEVEVGWAVGVATARVRVGAGGVQRRPRGERRGQGRVDEVAAVGLGVRDGAGFGGA